MIKVLIVEDHALVRLGIRRLLEDIKDFKVVGEASNGEEAIQLAKDLIPDVVLLDVKMPGMGGLEITRRLVRVSENIKVMAVTAYTNAPFPSRLLQAGAMGYLTKECSLLEMEQAIRKVHSGERHLSLEIAQQLALKSLTEPPEQESPFDCLSERELQVLLMITEGLKVQDISDKLCLSPKTVNSYRYRLFDKLKIKNDVELTHLALRHQLIGQPEFDEDNDI